MLPTWPACARGGVALLDSIAWGKVGTAGGKGGGEGGAALAALAAARVQEAGLFGAGKGGFTDKQVTGHTGFRLVSALRAEGLGGTRAVAAAFQGMGAPVGRGALVALRANVRSLVEG